MRSTWSSTVALVEGKSLAHALAVGGITFVSDPLAGAIVKMPVAKKMIERVAVPVTASTILRRTPADEVKTIVEKGVPAALDRKSTRLNSSHVKISYAVFCLKKKKKEKRI